MEILPLGSYQIMLGPAEEALASFLAARSYSRLVIIVDEHTRKYCLPRILPRIGDLDKILISIPAGERHKNLDTCRSIWTQMMEAAVDRRALAIDLGGGVVGDMGGFCAATFKRGIDFVQIPTTLLSQVDASIGGKLGIDFAGVKNSIGMFRDPEAVLIDPAFLKTLPPREIRSGFAEVIKHSLIADADQWQQLKKIEDLERVDWAAVLAASLRIKHRIVEEDPFEKGIRKALNFGHTIGHAIEGVALKTDTPLLHGEAVAAGMICEAYLSHRILGLPLEEVETISAFILSHYDHYPLEENNFETYLQLMMNDKKNLNRQINFALLEAVGKVRVNCTADLGEITDSLSFYNGLLVR